MGSFFGEAFGADDVRAGEGGGPGGEEHVVFKVEGYHVGYGVPEGLDVGFEVWGEGDWGEDSEVAGLETDLGEGVSFLDVRWEERGEIPIVALPPNFILPMRRKGRETVVTPGTSSRITITSSGFEGPEFAMIPVLVVIFLSFLSTSGSVCECVCESYELWCCRCCRCLTHQRKVY